MKTVKIIVALLALVVGPNSFAQTHDHSKMDMTTKITETIKVSGNCNMCKARIEKAARLDGVVKAEWNKKGKTLAATFDQAKTNIEEIGKKVAASGHDTEKVKATDAVYDKLPGCCKYR
jgi:periplasmic mercuric ion binding protein